jgi:parallel beta-helix repeat protein
MKGKAHGMNKNLFLFAVVLWLVPLLGEAAPLTVDCNAGEKIQPKIALAKPGDTVLVSGTCSENIAIPSEVVRITLDGQGKAVIQAPGTTADAIFIRGKDITIKGFTLTGGRDGIHLSGAAAGASAIIDGNAIQRTGRYGIHLDSSSVGRIANNRIENIPNAGIDITENSYARIGFVIPSAPKPGPNTIRNSGNHGIAVSRASSAWIANNTIADNKGGGVFVNRNSQADIVNNTINGNGGDGITASQNSGVNLRSEGTPLREGPNQTDPTTKNAGFGVKCSIGGYVEGPLGTLTGTQGAKEFDNSCIDRLSLP